MKTITLLPAALLAVIVSGIPALAEDNVKPAPAPVAAASVAEPAVIDHVVYLARLPTPAELMKGAEAQATPILRMDQTANQIVVVYQYAGGRTVTFAYTLLSSAGSAPAPSAQTSTATYSTQTVAVAPAPATTVVYAEPPTVYYSPGYVRYYDPAWDFWAPLAIGVGLGWGFGGWHGGGWHGGGHGGGWHGGGFHH
jgi:hypothetical protein